MTTLALSRRTRWILIASGAAASALLAPAVISAREWLGAARQSWPMRRPPPPWGGGIGFDDTSEILLLAGLAFVAALALMPFLLRWLERRVDRPGAAYYVRAGIAGIATGAGTAAVTAAGVFATALLVGGMMDPSTQVDAWRASYGTGTLAVGAVVLSPFVGIVMPFYLAPYIAITGVPLGLTYGALVRRLARPDLR